jgi:hypothetical protein
MAKRGNRFFAKKNARWRFCNRGMHLVAAKAGADSAIGDHDNDPAGQSEGKIKPWRIDPISSATGK